LIYLFALKEALEIYRKKDSLEKIFNSLKNEIEIKPLRIWSDDSIYGAIIIGFHRSTTHILDEI
jgi:transposase